MDFVRDKELINLKLMLRRKNENCSLYYVFEEDFEYKKNQSLRPFIAGAIYIWYKLKKVNFTVEENYWDRGALPNYQRKGYGTSILHYIENSLLPSLEETDKWIITIGNCEDTYERFKAHVIQKEKNNN